LAVEEKDVVGLRRLGLTEYEARIYLALVRMGPKKASEVSFFGQVPRTKAYGAIRELERKGLLRIIPGNPELYAPSSPSEVLMPLMAKLNRETKHSEDVIQALAVTYESGKFLKREAPKEVTEFWQMDGRQNVFNKITQVFNDARRAVNYSTSASGLIRAYKAHSDVLEKARRQGATVRVISPISTENASVAQEFSEIVDLRQIESPFTASFVSVDTRELVVIQSKPDDLRTDRGSDTAIWTSNRLLVELHEQLFDLVWSGLQPLKFSRQRSE